MAVAQVTSIILAIVCCATPVYSVCTWTEWTTCTADCGVSHGERTRDPSSDCNCAPPGVPIVIACKQEIHSPCGVRCGCDNLPCNVGVTGIACDQIGTDPRMYSCICVAGYAGNQSHDCNTALGSAGGASYEVTDSTPQTLTSPFYPDMYPLLLQATWTVYTAVGNTLLVTFDHFNLATPTSTDCVADYTVMRSDATTGLIQTLTDDQVNSVCPCIYDMLTVYEGSTTDIANIITTYCNNNSPPSTLTSSGHILTFEMRTDYTSDTTTNPGFSITVSLAPPPTSKPASNTVSSTQSTISSTTDGTAGGSDTQGGVSNHVLIPVILVVVVAVILIVIAAAVGYYVWNKRRTKTTMPVNKDQHSDETHQLKSHNTPAPQTGATDQADGEAIKLSSIDIDEKH